MVKGLNPRQTLFVEEYIKDPNATQAAIKAGYTPGLKDHTAQTTSYELLLNPVIIKALAVRRAEIVTERGDVVVTAEMVIAGLRKEANYDGPGATHGARINAWGLLGKILGLMVDRHEISGAGGQPIKITEVTINLPGKPGSGPEAVIEGDYHIKEDSPKALDPGQDPQ